MDSPDRRETHYVRCLKCNKILECSRYDTNALLEHIRTDHPEIEVVDSAVMPRKSKNQSKNQSQEGDSSQELSRTLTPEASEKSPQKKSQPNRSSSRESILERAQRVGVIRNATHQQDSDNPSSNRSNDSSSYTRRYQVKCPPSSINSNTNRSLYRTSIEKWRPANGSIYCPSCGTNQRPLIRTQAERSSNNSCCAACILGCWPFCFLPFLVPNDNKEYLHCSNCKNFLGLYDRENNCIKPNREFVQVEETLPREPPCKESTRNSEAWEKSNVEQKSDVGRKCEATPNCNQELKPHKQCCGA